MNKSIIITAALMLSSAVCVASAKAPVSKKLADGSITVANSVASTQREVSNDGMSITVNYSIPEAMVSPVGSTGLMKCTLEDFSTVEDPTLPALPVRYDAFEIPEGYEASVSLISSSASSYNVEIASVSPVSSSLNSLPVISKAVTSGIYPASAVSLDRIETYRGHEILCVRVSPASYDSSSASLSLAHQLSYKVTFSPKKVAALSTRKAVSERQELDDRIFLNSLVLNPQGFYPTFNPVDVPWGPAPKMLIVTRSKYSSALNRLVEWKKLLGYNVEILASASALTPSQIRNYTMQNSDAVALLIVGDEIDVPTNVLINYANGNGKSNMSTDMLYACTDSEEDRMPDMIYGRITVSSVSQLNNVLDKTLRYEQNPPTLSSFYDNVGIIAEFVDNDKYHTDENGIGKEDGKEDNNFINPAEKCRTHLLRNGKVVTRLYGKMPDREPMYDVNGDPLPDALQYPNFPWDATPEKINDFINDGTFLMFTWVHGAPTQFEHPAYSVNHIRQLSNGNLLPIFIGTSCELGAFNGLEDWIKTEDTFAETFLKKANGGCVGIMAASREVYIYDTNIISNYLQKEIYPDIAFGGSANYPEELQNYRYTHKMGDIIRNSLIQHNLNYGDWGKDYKFHLMAYHYFGDPTTRIYTREPQAAICELGMSPSDRMVFNYTPGATFTIVNRNNGDVYTSTGASTATYYLPPGCTSDDISYCVSGPNLRPYYVNGTPATGSLSAEEEIITSCEATGSNLSVSYIVDGSHKQSSEILISPTLQGQACRLPCADSNNVTVENLTPGVYVVALVIDGAVVDTKKIIIK